MYVNRIINEFQREIDVLLVGNIFLRKVAHIKKLC
jgi:hypothetical protein